MEQGEIEFRKQESRGSLEKPFQYGLSAEHLRE